MRRIVIFITVVVIIYLVSVIAINLPQKGTSTDEVSFNASPTGTANKATDVQSEELTVGQGQEAKAGDRVSVLYTGKLQNGTVFDSNTDKSNPFTFTLGAGDVIKGWDQGVAGMKVGGKRRLTISPELGYGDQANGKIPANATLVFEIDLLNVTTSQQAPNPDLNL